MEAKQQAEIGHAALRKASWRLLPLIGLGYGIAYLDRVNISFAALQMNQDLHFSATVYGLGGGLFFLSYAALEVPSNLILTRVGARRWLARIMITWGILAMAMMFVRTPVHFYIMRFLLGAAEAGFFPGVVYYLTHWFPSEHRGRAITRFYIALPLSTVVMGSIAGTLLGMHGLGGLAGWQWLFLIEGAPAVLLSALFFFLLPDGPDQARWLKPEERQWITETLARERTSQSHPGHGDILRALIDPLVLRLGVANLLILGSSYAFLLSLPTVLTTATGESPTVVGFVTAGAALVGAVAMLVIGWHSDRRRQRMPYLLATLAVVIAGFVVLALSSTPAATIAASCAAYVGFFGIQASFWLVPTDLRHGRDVAVGVAAIGSIGMIGAFAGPLLWGVLFDATGGFRTGQAGIVALLVAATGVLLSLRRSERRAAAFEVPATSA